MHLNDETLLTKRGKRATEASEEGAGNGTEGVKEAYSRNGQSKFSLLTRRLDSWLQYCDFCSAFCVS